MNNNILIFKQWESFKSEVINREMCPQWYEHERGAPDVNQYKIYAQDGFFMFQTILNKDAGSDCIDFENNYKDSWNAKLEYRDENGLIRVHESPRPCNNTTYFTGAGDTGGLASGNNILFKINSTDTSKQIDVEFSEDIFIKDAIIQFDSAPFGSYIDVQIIHPTNGVVANYIKKLFLIGTNTLYINSEDSAKITQGLKIRSTVYNSTGTGDEDPAGDFKVTGTIEMYRSTII